MEPNVKLPTIEEVADYLKEYGWNFREQTSPKGTRYILTNYRLLNDESKGILISLSVQGEFVMVSSVNFLMKVSRENAEKFLSLNDRIKLVKLYSISSPEEPTLSVEIGFELWAEAWNKGTFFAFMDCLCFGIDETLKQIRAENTEHDTQFVTYQQSPQPAEAPSPQPVNPNTDQTQ